MSITSAILPDDSFSLRLAYAVALDIVNLKLAIVSVNLYTLAVYNLGGDNLLNFAQDVVGAPPYGASDNPDKLPYFAYMRQRFKLLDFTPGVVQSSSDESTSVSLVVQEAAKDFKLADLQNLKTPYGRQYLSIAQRVGPSAWGLT